MIHQFHLRKARPRLAHLQRVCFPHQCNLFSSVDPSFLVAMDVLKKSGAVPVELLVSDGSNHPTKPNELWESIHPMRSLMAKQKTPMSKLAPSTNWERTT